MAVSIAMMDNSSTNTTPYASDARQAPYELVRSDRFDLIKRMSFPESYTVNSKRESSCLLFVETFKSQFAQLFPSRPPLLLDPLNECMTQKFISSFVRPSQLKYKELYDYNSTANFLANYVVYEPLEEQERVPTRIVSPATVLEWQVANSIELSITLCSLLCGSGYNAYVAVGRAARDTVESNRESVHWSTRADELRDEVNSDDDVPPPEPRNNRFWQKMKIRPKLTSEYDRMMAEDGVEDELYMMRRHRPQMGHQAPENTLRGGTLNMTTTMSGGLGTTMNLGGTMNNLGQTMGAGGNMTMNNMTVGGANSTYGQNFSALLQSQQTTGTNNADATVLSSNGDDGGENASSSNRYISPLVHAWVMILPSGTHSKKRPVDNIVCIEPSTGLTFELDDENYQSVETVFNHINCFVNMNPLMKPSELKWDLYELESWESVFLTDSEIVTSTSYQRDADVSSGSVHGGGLGGTSSKLLSSTAGGSTGGGSSTGGGGGNTGSGSNNGPLADLSAAIANASWAPNDGGDLSLDLPASWVAPLTVSPAQVANRFPNRCTTIRYADAIVTRFAEYSDPELRVLEVRIKDDQDPRTEQVHTFFKHRHDFLKRRSRYPALDCKPGQDPLEDPRKIHEWFLPGRKAESRVEGLRELIQERGKHRTMRFYWRSRDDGLARRAELWNEGDRSQNPNMVRKIIEEYKGRDSTDCLTYRAATFQSVQMNLGGAGSGVHSSSGGAGGSSVYSSMQLANEVALAAQGGGGGGPSGHGGGSSGGLGVSDKEKRPPERMAEKYGRNSKLEAEDDVMKLKFLKPLNSEGEIWVNYHYPVDCITYPYRQFPKEVERDRADASSGLGSQSTFSDPSTMPLVVTAPFQPKPREPELREQLRRLLTREKECLNEIGTKMDECAVIIDQRKKDEQGLTPVLSSYDTLRNKSRETDRERELKRELEHQRALSRNDYLAPYIAALDLERNLRGVDTASQELSVENAKLVRDCALKDLKDRLIQRGHIMQARLDQEKEELYRRQAAFQKNLDANNEGAADSEAFAKYCSDAAWRMKILDERLSRHIEDAGNRYAALARKLSEDPRLAKLYGGDVH